MSASGSGTTNSLTGSSSSPQSRFSASPLSTHSPAGVAVTPNSQYPLRQTSMPVLSNAAALDPSNHYMRSGSASWIPSFSQDPTMQVPLTNQQWQRGPQQMLPQQVLDPALALFPGSSPLIGTAGSINESPRSTQMLPPQSLGTQRGSTSSLGSPHQHLAPTPSLTSHSTSPSSLDEPAERRSSQFSSSPGIWQDRTMGKSVESNASFVPESNYAIPSTYSPTANTTQAVYPPDFSGSSNFPSPGSTDLGLEFRQSFASDDEDGPPSSTASTYVGLDDVTLNAIQQRRQASAGLWATAFNQMTLRDGTYISLPANMSSLSNPYAANQIAQQFPQKRPSFPMFSAADGADPIKIPSLSDTKDLWKLFMADPAAAQTPGVGDPNEYLAPGLTPRPGIGRRTLSKSNSMPDLLSPLLHGQTSLSTYPTGITPQPDVPQQGYIPTQEPVADVPSASDDLAMIKWRNEIQQRQTFFNMMPGGRMGQASQPHPALLPTSFHLSGRPMASVLQQYPTALQQTLAPERTPSFGVSEQSGSASHLHSFAKTPSKLSSAMARPGNKRLASQTLGPEPQKKGGFESWYEADDGSLADAEDEVDVKVTPATRSWGEAIYPTGTYSASPLSYPPISGELPQTAIGLQPYPPSAMYYSTWPPIGGNPEFGKAGP